MFSFKNKLDPNLKIAIDKKYYKNYRVIIHCKTLSESIEKKVKTYKGSMLSLYSSYKLYMCYSIF